MLPIFLGLQLKPMSDFVVGAGPFNLGILANTHLVFTHQLIFQLYTEE